MASGPERPLPIEAGQTVGLRVGQSARTSDGALRFGFEGVGADSRCPKGEQCVWAGDATVRIWLQRKGGPRERVELHTTTGAAKVGQPAAPELRLLRLEPTPVSGRTLAQRDYVATLALGTER